MILVKKFKFFHILCLSKIDLEKVFAVVLHKKDAFKDHKITLYEKRKVRIFQKGLIHHFAQRLKISSTSIFMQNQPRKTIRERSS